MIIAGTRNARAHMAAGMDVLREGGTALDAVEKVTRAVEDDREEHSVGLGGYPNLLGEVELDGSIMDGRTRACGAVGALRRHANPVSIARAVMERMEHVFLVGEGADAFAAEAGFDERDLLTDEAFEQWSERIAANVPAAEYGALLTRRRLLRFALLAKDPERIHGTVNVIALDAAGHMASAVSTSGWAWKYPGRLGDSPVIGAGNYCDERFGAATCSGHGELAIRGTTARCVLFGLEAGLALQEATTQAVRSIPFAAAERATVVVVIGMDCQGRHCAVSNSSGAWGYAYMGEEDPEPRLGEPVVVAAASRR